MPGQGKPLLTILDRVSAQEGPVTEVVVLGGGLAGHPNGLEEREICSPEEIVNAPFLQLAQWRSRSCKRPQARAIS